MEYRKCELLLLPTKEFQTSAIVLGVKVQGYNLPVARATKDVLDDNDWLHHGTPHHLYIISKKERIMDDDWFYNGIFAAIEKVVKSTYVTNELIETLNENEYNYKIIASTNPALTIDKPIDSLQRFWHLPWIPESFVHKFLNEYNSGTQLNKALVAYEEFAVSNRDAEKVGRRLLVDNSANTIIIRKAKNKWNREEIENILIKCCSEIVCEDGTLKGKYPADLLIWMEENL